MFPLKPLQKSHQRHSVLCRRRKLDGFASSASGEKELVSKVCFIGGVGRNVGPKQVAKRLLMREARALHRFAPRREPRAYVSGLRLALALIGREA